MDISQYVTEGFTLGLVTLVTVVMLTVPIRWFLRMVGIL